MLLVRAINRNQPLENLNWIWIAICLDLPLATLKLLVNPSLCLMVWAARCWWPDWAGSLVHRSGNSWAVFSTTRTPMELKMQQSKQSQTGLEFEINPTWILDDLDIRERATGVMDHETTKFLVRLLFFFWIVFLVQWRFNSDVWFFC